VKRSVCRIQIDFHPSIANDIVHWSRRDSAQKQQVLRFIQTLVFCGYRHLILAIEQPSDVWVAQMLCSCQAALNDVFSYTIGVWRYDEADSNWIEALPFDWDAITKRANCVKIRSQNWYEERCYTERLYVSDSEKWYDASDRCNTEAQQHRYATFTRRRRSMQEKLSEVFVEQYQALLGVAFQLTRNEDDALDLMQDLAETIAKNDRPASSIEHPMAFFRTCLRNARINSLKKSQREVPSEPEVFSQIPGKESVESDVVGGAAMAWLKKELDSYPPEMREAFYLYFFDGYSLDEVAKKLNINKNTLSQRFVRIRSKLVKKAADQSLFFALMVLFLLKPR
jgi:RNA polymerase sigma-70 factor (ECF subfamily)